MPALAVKPDDAEKIDLTEQDHQSDSGHRANLGQAIAPHLVTAAQRSSRDRSRARHI
jgi:hypothetical protein